MGPIESHDHPINWVSRESSRGMGWAQLAIEVHQDQRARQQDASLRGHS